MPEPFSLLFFGAAMRAATVKTVAAAPVKAALASSSLAINTGAVSSTVCFTLMGLTLIGATMCAIGVCLERVLNDGYISRDEGKRYAKKIQEKPRYQQQAILASIEDLSSNLVKGQLNYHGIY